MSMQSTNNYGYGGYMTKKAVTTREYDQEGRIVKETVEETTYYPYTATWSGTTRH